MEKLRLIKAANAFLFFAALGQGSTGLFLFFVDRGPWVEAVARIHRYSGLVLMTLIGIHITLFWPVIKHHYFTKVIRPTTGASS